MNNSNEQFEEFMRKLSKNPYNVDTIKNSSLSGKYESISVAALSHIETNSFNLKTIKNWSKQDDMGVPIQISRLKAFNAFYIQNFIRFLRNTYPKRWLIQFFQRQSLRDDLQIVIEKKYDDILRNNPVSKIPFTRDVYYKKGMSFNSRYLRYVYLVGQIRKFNLLGNALNEIHVDIGNFYGGLQVLLKQYYPKTTFISIELPHQLFRSYLFHRMMFPQSESYIGVNGFENYLENRTENAGAFIYLLPSDYHVIGDKVVPDLITNYASFGEMSRKNFEEYLNSRTTLKAQRFHFVNRFISSPTLDPTYLNDINIRDYFIENTAINFFDIFPIHHHSITKRLFLGKRGYRNNSSPSFELILTRID